MVGRSTYFKDIPSSDMATPQNREFRQEREGDRTGKG